MLADFGSSAWLYGPLPTPWLGSGYREAITTRITNTLIAETVVTYLWTVLYGRPVPDKT